MHYGYKRRKRLVNVVAPTYEDIKGDPKVDMVMVMAIDMVGEVVYPPHVSIAVRLVMSRDFSPNRV
jgi:hypothetical protein